MISLETRSPLLRARAVQFSLSLLQRGFGFADPRCPLGSVARSPRAGRVARRRCSPRRCRAHACLPPTRLPQPLSDLDLPAGRAAWSCCTSSLAEKINNLFNKAFYPLYILSLIKILHGQKVQKLV